MTEIKISCEHSFEEVSILDEEEREYLEKVAKMSHLKDKLSSEPPKKNEAEKLAHQFEILKGQIIAGNDNVQVVKKFKALLNQLKSLKMLSRSDVNDILTDLNSLGY